MGVRSFNKRKITVDWTQFSVTKLDNTILSQADGSQTYAVTGFSCEKYGNNVVSIIFGKETVDLTGIATDVESKTELLESVWTVEIGNKNTDRQIENYNKGTRSIKIKDFDLMIEEFNKATEGNQLYPELWVETDLVEFFKQICRFDAKGEING